MTDTAHTSGPWSATGYNIDAIQGRIARIEPGATDAERTANAALIAAAPELLHACKMALLDQYDPKDVPDGWDVAEGLDAAIAKATK